MTRSLSVFWLTILFVLTLTLPACSSKSDDACDDPTKQGCPEYASPEEITELRQLVQTYMDAKDDAAAEGSLATILGKRAATVSRLTPILGEARERGPQKTGTIMDVPFKVGSMSSDYSMWVPPTYDPATPFPLILCLHGAFFTGSEYVEKWQPRLGDKYMLVCPTSEDWWTLPSEAFVFALLDDVTSRYNIDPNRIFLSGMSDGGTGTFVFGAHRGDRFAGVAPMAAGFGLFDFLQNFVATPVYYIHNVDDQVMPIALGRKIVKTLTEDGVDVTFRESTEEKPEVGNHFFPASELPALITWLDGKTRNSYPKRLDYLRDAPHLGRYFWSDIVDAPGLDAIDWSDPDFTTKPHKFAEFKAEITEGRIDVTTKNVVAFRILLNDELVNLDKPVEIYTNGVLSFSGKIVRSPETLLREARTRHDRAMLFSAAVPISVP